MANISRANCASPVEVAAGAVRRAHDRPEFCDDLEARLVERDDSPDLIVCAGCPEDPDVGLTKPPILWRDGEGVVTR